MKFSFTTMLAFAATTFIFSGVVAATYPPSDECSTATNIPISDLPYIASVSISNYTYNATDPTSCDLIGRTMWWKFTAPADGVLSVLTDDVRLRFGPGLDLNIGSIAGSCDNSAEMKCGVNFFSGSAIAHPIVHAGVTYFIEVGETPASMGDAQFNFTVKFDPLNLTVSGDECPDAIVVPTASLPFNQIVDTRVYTSNENDPIAVCGYGAQQNTIFYQYTPTTNGLMIIDTMGSVSDGDGNLYDLTVSVFTGNCSSTKEVFCDEQNWSETTHYPVTAGTTYTIRLGGYEIGGLVNFTLSFQRNYFNLVNEKKKKNIGVLNDLYNGMYPDALFPTNTIDYASFGTPSLSIEAIFPMPNSIQSVRLQLDNQRSICKDKSAGYKMVGEMANSTIPFAIGNRIIAAKAFSKSACTGNVLGALSQQFFVKGCDFIQYGLYGPRGGYISNLYNGSSISNPPCQANIGVTFECGFTPKNVRFELRRASDNSLVIGHTELNKPYFLFANNFGIFTTGKIHAGEYKLTAFIDNIAHPSVTFTMGTCSATPVVDRTFGIDLRFSDGVSNEQSKLFPNIVKRISSLIVGDRPDFINIGKNKLAPDYFCGDFPPRIDDLHICAGIRSYEDGVGGILGFLLNAYSGPSDNLPISGTIIFDSEDMSYMIETGNADNFILQQLIRTLGLGESWEQFGLVNSGTPPCSYNGGKAKAEFEAITGCSSDIPLEQNSIPEVDGYGELTFDCKFWDPACLKDEVLTYTLGTKKISRITLGALEDLGYAVNYTAADPYGPSDIGTCAGCNVNRKLKGQVLNQLKRSTSSCYSGIVHERAIRHGRKMLRNVHDHHMEQTKNKPPHEGIMFTGNHRVTVVYEHEDGALCSVVVPADFLV